jgi:hypothetical protein
MVGGRRRQEIATINAPDDQQDGYDGQGRQHHAPAGAAGRASRGGSRCRRRSRLRNRVKRALSIPGGLAEAELVLFVGRARRPLGVAAVTGVRLSANKGPITGQAQMRTEGDSRLVHHHAS